MANRVFKFARAKRRKIAIQPLKGASDICAFCGNSIAGSHLNAASRLDRPDGAGPLAVICSRCIDQLAGMSKLTGWYQRYFRNENFWPLLESLVRKRIAGENGTKAVRDAVVDLLMRLAKRSCAIISGQRRNGLEACQKTGVPLAQPRIAVVCPDPDGFLQMLFSGADVIGLPVLAVATYDAMNGSAYQNLKRTRCNGDSIHAENGLLIVADGFPDITDDVGVLYMAGNCFGIPDGIEIVTLPDDSDDPFGTAFS